MGNIRNGLVEMRKNSAAGFSECIAAAEGRIDGLWRIIAADLASAKYCRHPPNLARRPQYAALLRPASCLTANRSDPAWFLQGWRQASTGIAVRLLFQSLPALCNLRVEQLTRRATHRYIFIVATIKPTPENPLRVF
ncbi:hypothetical protein [Bradyrhizobium australafricanum]|uniref:hypothetical protein n=1 Tax=Bradyrhizobium australafricanum TaxID=2821406 RepID=UPI001CE36C16|nr:hypothetical protein [Bradyrhizobium australafricanum]MCA6104773.1 hypothetical protein [Bradyrhizobium australafricanum]